MIEVKYVVTSVEACAVITLSANEEVKQAGTCNVVKALAPSWEIRDKSLSTMKTEVSNCQIDTFAWWNKIFPTLKKHSIKKYEIDLIALGAFSEV